MTFGERLKARRLEMHLSRAALGAACGVAESTVSRWERNAVRPSPRHLGKVAKTLKTSGAQLIFGTPEPPVRSLMPVLASMDAFAAYLDARLVDLVRQARVVRALRQALQ